MKPHIKFQTFLTLAEHDSETKLKLILKISLSFVTRFAQISGERLQGHWSSGCIRKNKGCAVTMQLISTFVFAT